MATKKPIDKSYLEQQFSGFYNYIKTDDDIVKENKIESVSVNGTTQTISNKKVNIVVPTKLSDLEDVTNVVIDTNYVHTDNNLTDELKNKITNVDTTSVFSGKTIAFFGDSVGAGSGWRASDGIIEGLGHEASALPTNMRGWAKVLQENHSDATVINYSTYGATIARSLSSECLYNQLTLMESQSVVPDYIVLQGGANDAMQQVTIGDVSDYTTRDTTNFDEYKTISYFEILISDLIQKYPSAKIIYMTNPRMYLDSAYSWVYTNLDEILKKIKSACEKWGIPVLDMEKTCPMGSINPSYRDNSTYYTDDKFHPLAPFYRESVYQIEAALITPVPAINPVTNITNNTTVNNTGTGLDTGWVTVEQYGAISDGVTDCTEAFKQAFLSGYKITCAPTNSARAYKFDSYIDCGEVDTRQIEFDGSDCTFYGFSMMLNIQAGTTTNGVFTRYCDWKSIYRWKGMLVRNCTFSSKGITWGDAMYGKQYFTPCFISGMPMEFENVILDYQYVLLAYIDRYIDKLYCRNVYLVSDDTKYSANKVTNLENYAMIMRIDKNWNLMKIGTNSSWASNSTTDQPSAGDGWIFESCNEIRQWSLRDSSNNIIEDNQDSKYVIAVASQSLPMTFRQCINSSIGWGESAVYNSSNTVDYYKMPIVTCYGCHFEEGGFICFDERTDSQHKSPIQFDSCYFYGGCKRPYHTNVTYINCIFRVDLDATIGKTLKDASKQKKQNLTQLCKYINCRYGSNNSLLDTYLWNQELGGNLTNVTNTVSVKIATDSSGATYHPYNASTSETGTWTVTTVVRNFENSQFAYIKDTQTVSVTSVADIIQVNINGAICNQMMEYYLTAPSGTIYRAVTKYFGQYNGSSIWFYTSCGTWCCNGSQNPMNYGSHVISPYSDSLEITTTIPTIIVNNKLFKLASNLLAYDGDSSSMVKVGGYMVVSKSDSGVNYIYQKDNSINNADAYNVSNVIR